mmetsp:Transcript_24188/g.48108  ORF Transcript_24188/g.48108 Transcript_24188/m.48108 type:complete len:293 (+) Transcript_24188:751-1629(+)
MSNDRVENQIEKRHDECRRQFESCCTLFGNVHACVSSKAFGVIHLDVLIKYRGCLSSGNEPCVHTTDIYLDRLGAGKRLFVFEPFGHNNQALVTVTECLPISSVKDLKEIQKTALKRSINKGTTPWSARVRHEAVEAQRVYRLDLMAGNINCTTTTVHDQNTHTCLHISQDTVITEAVNTCGLGLIAQQYTLITIRGLTSANISFFSRMAHEALGRERPNGRDRDYPGDVVAARLNLWNFERCATQVLQCCYKDREQGYRLWTALPNSLKLVLAVRKSLVIAGDWARHVVFI